MTVGLLVAMSRGLCRHREARSAVAIQGRRMPRRVWRPARRRSRAAVAFGLERAEVPARVHGGWMISPEALFVDCQRSAHERLGLAAAVRVLEQYREIVEGRRHVGMVRSEALFEDRQRAAIERFGLGEAVRGS